MNNFDIILNKTLMFTAQKAWTKDEKDFFDALSLFLAKELNVHYIIIGKLLTNKNTVQTLSFASGGKIESNVVYDLINTPCENVIGKNLCCYPDNIQNLFPFDQMLVDMKAESYIGLPLWDTKGNAIGLIALLDTKPIDNSSQIESILQVVSSRIAHEIERADFEKKLIEKNKKLEEADKLKTAFLANMSHEIRTPMTAITGFTNLLKSPISEEKKSYFIDIIEKRSNDLLNIINDLFDISKIESNQLKLIEAEVNVKTLIDEIIYGYIPSLKEEKENKISFKLNIENIDNLNIYTDPDRLRQVIVNLLSNAFKFTQKGSVELGCKLDQGRKQLTFYVKDTGIGIHPTKHTSVFERFRQVDDKFITQRFGGTGLGLSISKGIVELMKGHIEVVSEEGKGACFYFNIPIKETKRINTPLKRKTPSLNNIKNITILVVEDDTYNSKYLHECFSNNINKILIAKNGNEAIQLFMNNSNIDLILMDIKLPDINGIDVAKKILNMNPSMKIIAQTAYASQQDKLNCMNAGFSGFISKPINETELFTLIQETTSKDYC